MALLGRPPSDDKAFVGAAMVAEGLFHVKIVAEFCAAVSKSLRKKGR